MTQIGRPNISKLIGKSYDQANCWDLTREFYMLSFQIELKHYTQSGTPQDRREIQNLVYSNRGDFDTLDMHLGLEYGDILLFKIKGIESHIGVYIGEGKFLHTMKASGSVLDSIEKWKHVLVGAYRHRGIKGR